MKLNITIDLSKEEVDKLYALAKSQARDVSITKVIEKMVRVKLQQTNLGSSPSKEMEVEI